MSNNNQNKADIIICPFCGTKYSSQKQSCPNCHKTPYGESQGYTPMSDEKIKKIRIGLGIVLVAVFIVLYLVLNR